MSKYRNILMAAFAASVGATAIAQAATTFDPFAPTRETTTTVTSVFVGPIRPLSTQVGGLFVGPARSQTASTGLISPTGTTTATDGSTGSLGIVRPTGTDGMSGPIAPSRPPIRDPFRPPIRSPYTP